MRTSSIESHIWSILTVFGTAKIDKITITVQ
jgi:hypothetical protein